MGRAESGHALHLSGYWSAGRSLAVSAMTSIGDSIRENEYVILDTTKMSGDDIDQLRRGVAGGQIGMARSCGGHEMTERATATS